MTYALPLSERMRHAANKRAQYWSDPEYRLACINRTRARKGRPPINNLSEMGNPVVGRPGAKRDARGRFV